MKIAVVSTLELSVWGGSEELWYETVLQLHKHGNEVIVCIVDLKQESAKIRNLRSLGIEVFKRHSIKRSRLINLVLKFAPKKLLVRYYFGRILEFKPDVLILSQGDTFGYANALRFGSLISSLKARIILISQFNYDGGYVLKEPTAKVALQLLPKVDLFYFVSRRNFLTAERQLARKIESARLISNPATIRKVEVKPYPEGDTLRIACVARLDCAFKGQDLLLAALNTDLWKARDFQLNFYGKGKDENYLKNLVKFYGLDARVIFKGHVDDIDTIWLENHALVLASIAEGTPLSLIEAMLSGRAALGTDVGGISDYIMHMKTGFLSKAPTVALLHDALEELWSNRDNLKAMGMNAFEHALKITDLKPWEKIENDIKLLTESAAR